MLHINTLACNFLFTNLPSYDIKAINNRNFTTRQNSGQFLENWQIHCLEREAYAA